MKIIEIGTTVKVTGMGGIYTTASRLAECMQSSLYRRNAHPKMMMFKVANSTEHRFNKRVVYLLANREGEFIFDAVDSQIEVVEGNEGASNLTTQTPEEKEALGTMTGISREHLMKMISQQSEIIKELSEKLNTSESPNGSNEIIKPLWAKWSIGDSVTKTKGSSWTGKVVGYYQTDLTSKGYAVESETEKGSVQIYPEAALCSAETEVERVEREEFLKEAKKYISPNSGWSLIGKAFAEKLFEAGCRFDMEGKL